ncbi:hypothetical protein Droror1_Dr00010800 [Drosera rotundifolia]
MKKKMMILLGILFLHQIALTSTVEGYESGVEVQILTLSDPIGMKQEMGDLPLAVSVSPDDLYEVSNSVLVAESWLRTNVLAYYPKSRIAHVVVGHDVLCVSAHEDKFELILPCSKNIYYALTRWGLEREIKVSPSVSSRCVKIDSGSDLGEKLMKPLLEFMESINSTYVVNPVESSDELVDLVSAHLQYMKKFGSLKFKDINVVTSRPNWIKPISRKLSVVDSEPIDPFPARPTPLIEPSPSSSIHITIPAHIANSPLSPVFGSTSLPPVPLSLAPQPSPVVVIPAAPPSGYQLPPCRNPVVAPPETGPVMPEKLWCVAKPSVPPEKLQEALDFACGAGSADCEEIQPMGSCYYPDTAVAHASFAFNSYWQKNKRLGGTCSFGGTAMIINADPSFMSCKFKVT